MMPDTQPIRTAFISRYGDRRSGDFIITKTGVNEYTFDTHVFGAGVFVQVFTLTPDRASTQLFGLDGVCHVYTYNLRDGHHPGSDLCVVIHPLHGSTIGAYARLGDNPLCVNAHVGDPNGDHGRGVGARLRRVRLAQPLPEVLHNFPWRWVVQPLTNHFAMPSLQTPATALGEVAFETLITRVPPTPVETNVEVALVRHIGPIRNR